MHVMHVYMCLYIIIVESGTVMVFCMTKEHAVSLSGAINRNLSPDCVRVAAYAHSDDDSMTSVYVEQSELPFNVGAQHDDRVVVPQSVRVGILCCTSGHSSGLNPLHCSVVMFLFGFYDVLGVVQACSRAGRGGQSRSLCVFLDSFPQACRVIGGRENVDVHQRAATKIFTTYGGVGGVLQSHTLSKRSLRVLSICSVRDLFDAGMCIPKFLRFLLCSRQLDTSSPQDFPGGDCGVCDYCKGSVQSTLSTSDRHVHVQPPVNVSSSVFSTVDPYSVLSVQHCFFSPNPCVAETIIAWHQIMRVFGRCWYCGVTDCDGCGDGCKPGRDQRRGVEVCVKCDRTRTEHGNTPAIRNRFQAFSGCLEYQWLGENHSGWLVNLRERGFVSWESKSGVCNVCFLCPVVYQHDYSVCSSTMLKTGDIRRSWRRDRGRGFHLWVHRTLLSGIVTVEEYFFLLLFVYGFGGFVVNCTRSIWKTCTDSPPIFVGVRFSKETSCFKDTVDLISEDLRSGMDGLLKCRPTTPSVAGVRTRLS